MLYIKKIVHCELFSLFSGVFGKFADRSPKKPCENIQFVSERMDFYYLEPFFKN